MSTTTLINILIVVVVIAAAVFGYVYVYDGETPGFLGFGGETQTTESGVPPRNLSDPQLTTQRILSLISELEKIKIDTALFSDPVFQSLEDYRVPVEPEEKGVTNPFTSL